MNDNIIESVHNDETLQNRNPRVSFPVTSLLTGLNNDRINNEKILPSLQMRETAMIYEA